MSVLVLLRNLTCAQVNEKGVANRGLGSLIGHSGCDRVSEKQVWKQHHCNHDLVFLQVCTNRSPHGPVLGSTKESSPPDLEF